MERVQQMTIRCPNCGLAKTLSKDAFPAYATRARCQKCQQVFDLKQEYITISPDQPIPAPTTNQVKPSSGVITGMFGIKEGIGDVSPPIVQTIRTDPELKTDSVRAQTTRNADKREQPLIIKQKKPSLDPRSVDFHDFIGEKYKEYYSE